MGLLLKVGIKVGMTQNWLVLGDWRHHIYFIAVYNFKYLRPFVINRTLSYSYLYLNIFSVITVQSQS